MSSDSDYFPCTMLQWPDMVRNPGPKGPTPIATLGRRLESWPDTLAAGKAVRGTGHSQKNEDFA